MPNDRFVDYLDSVRISARTKHSLVKKPVLRDAVRQARTVGYAFTDQELEVGLRSIAVPVFDGKGDVVAAMSASASSARVTVAQMIKGFVPVLRKSADGLGRVL
jgi:IclR family transcriptional regulator, pca regulon regulatory protein